MKQRIKIFIAENDNGNLNTIDVAENDNTNLMTNSSKSSKQIRLALVALDLFFIR